VDEISLFIGKNPVSGMLNPKDGLAVFLLSFAQLPETLKLRNNLVMFPLDKII
jgi:hypothetical protein